MTNGLRLIACLLLVTAAFSLQAAPQITESPRDLSHAAPMTAMPDFSIWILFAVGAIAVVVARKRT